MSHISSNFNSNSGNKRPGDSKYLNSFLPESNVSGQQSIKRQKLDHLITVVNSGPNKSNFLTDNKDVDKCVTKIKAVSNKARECSIDNVKRQFNTGSGSSFIPSKTNAVTSSVPSDKYNNGPSQSISDLEAAENAWFQDCWGLVVQTCSQVEAEVGIETSRVEKNEDVKLQANSISTNARSNNKPKEVQQNVKLQTFSKAPLIKQSKTTPLRRTASGSDWPTTYTNSSSCSQQNLSVFGSIKKVSDRESISSATNENEIERLHNELKALKEKFQTKEGEVRLLRTNFESVKSELQKQKLEKLKDDEMIQLEMNKQIRNYEYEIHELKNLCKTMDVVIAKKHQDFLPFEVPNHHTKANGTFPNGSVFSPKKVSSSKKEIDLTQEEIILMQGDALESCDNIQACQLLLEIITPDLFYKSKPETIALDPHLFNSSHVLRSKTDLTSKKKGSSRDTYNSTDAERANSVSLGTTCLTLESCYQPLIMLTKMVDLSNKQSHTFLLKIIIESVKILEELLLRLRTSTLRERFMDREKEIYDSWHTYLQLNKDYNLLHFRPWYDDEKGVEARRCLGLISVLAKLSRFVLLLLSILPTFDISLLDKDKIDMYGDIKMLLSDDINKDEINKSRSILFIIRDIVDEIGKQRRTLSFEGVQTGALEIILSLTKHEVQLPEDSQQVILDILKKVVFARPGSAVLLKVFQLLQEVVRYPFITNQLCCKTAKKTCVEDYWEITYTSDTCIVQMLCIMIRQLPETFRYKLTDAFVSWLYSLFAADQDIPSWLYLSPDNTRCQCRSLISQLTVTLLGEVCRKYEKGEIKDKKILKKVLPTGVFLVQNLVYQDENFPLNVGEYRGQLVLFLDAINNFRSKIDFHLVTCKILEKLTAEEELREFSMSSDESEELSGLLSSIYLRPES